MFGRNRRGNKNRTNASYIIFPTSLQPWGRRPVTNKNSNNNKNNSNNKNNNNKKNNNSNNKKTYQSKKGKQHCKQQQQSNYPPSPPQVPPQGPPQVPSQVPQVPPQVPSQSSPQSLQNEQWEPSYNSFEPSSITMETKHLMKQRVKIENAISQSQHPQHDMFKMVQKAMPQYKTILHNMGKNDFESYLFSLYDDEGLMLLPNGDYCIEEWDEKKRKLQFKKRWHCTKPFGTNELCCDCAWWVNGNKCKHTLFCCFHELSAQLQQPPLAVKPDEKHVINESVVYLGDAQRGMILFCFMCKDIL